MDWYYSDGRQQFGPVTEAEFDTLVASGRIGANTLVWRAGMSNWSPLGTVHQPAPAAAVAPAPEQPPQEARFCSQCGRPFAPGDLLQIGNATVCASCKDVMMQRLREGVMPIAQPHARPFAGFWIRFVAVFIDGIILGVAGVIISVPFGFMRGAIGEPMPLFGRTRGIFSYLTLVQMAVAMLYEAWFVVAKGATPGKLALSLEVICADGTRPGWGVAIGRHFAKLLSSWFTLGIGYIMAGIDDEKRALHDRICETRVVRN